MGSINGVNLLVTGLGRVIRQFSSRLGSISDSFESSICLTSIKNNAENIKYLENSSIWIMGRTFKTVLTIFKQLYTIHKYVGGEENSRIIPLVYTLMSSKSEECYKKCFKT